ncbi:hypothetical protein BG842_06635 [Haladaptatus sp. W1]|uniref:hypothetical protein n=1 Tax=Haladaptatus sp. W1 TaxID=1897478 RepID=UPI0008497D62|nr:hypothetical protein [Haladaptatus sp. W1]ODR79572.1 hypothetical protein BG842_06635 [Haladaptatus sp. W1]
MSLLKINIEKPALVEERVYPDRDSAPATASTKSESSCPSLSSVLKPLLGLLFVVGAALFVAKRRSGTDDEDDEISADDFSSEPAGSGNLTRKLGLLASLLGVVLVARKRRGGNDDE